mmetsp:Transcript_10680/g.16178  ORF Transcript_10680/g.16178 Transcript_10680/m.16178 type:complete len:412 (+) Transcript_10680:200-1435(+)
MQLYAPAPVDLLNSWRRARWELFIKQWKGCDSLHMEADYISRNSNAYEHYLHTEVSATLDLRSIYQMMAFDIPTEWFTLEHDDSDKFFRRFDRCHVLSSIKAGARYRIWIDVPRTFDVFARKCKRCENVLSCKERQCALKSILCRVLCVSTVLLGGWYSQGMSFVAASCVLYFYHAFETASHDLAECLDDLELSVGTYACAAYHRCFLVENAFEALYLRAPSSSYGLLEQYLEVFSHELSRHPVAVVPFRHLESLGLSLHYYAVEWFTACFTLSLCAEACELIQDIILCGTDRKNDVLIKVGVAVLAELVEDIVVIESKEVAHVRLRSLTMALPASRILPRALTLPPISFSSSDEAAAARNATSPTKVIKEFIKRRLSASSSPSLSTTSPSVLVASIKYMSLYFKICHAGY